MLEWRKISKDKPKDAQRVVVYKPIKNKHYFLTYCHDKDLNHFWKTEAGSYKEVHESDLWMLFPFIETEYKCPLSGKKIDI